MEPMILLAVCLAAAEPQTAPAAALPAIAEDMRTDPRPRLVCKGPVDWQPGRLRLGTGALVGKQIAGGPEAVVELRFQWPALTQDGQNALTRLVLSIDGASDAVVTWSRRREKGREEAALAIADTAVNVVGARTETTIRSLPLVGDAATRTAWRIGYAYGHFVMMADGRERMAGYIENAAAAVVGVRMEQPAGTGMIAGVRVVSAPAPAMTAEQQRWDAEANQLSIRTVQLDQQGKHHEALQLATRAVALRRQTVGEAHAFYALALFNLGVQYHTLGQHARAEELYRQARAIAKAAVGEAHPYHGLVTHNLGMLYKDIGDYDKARSLLTQASTISEKALGAAHPTYAQSLNGLAELYESAGDYGKAEPLLVQVRDIMKRALTETHPLYARSLNNLAMLYNAMGDFSRAAPLYRQTCDIYRRSLGESHPYYATALNNLAMVYHDTGDDDKAEPLFLQALDIIRKRLGEAHPD